MAQAQFPPGMRIHHYVVHKEIARGGQGVVLEAQHANLGITVALKLLLDRSQQARARFLQEARTLAQLEHPGLVRIPDFGELPDGTPFLVMQHVQGDDLEALVRREGLFPPERIVRNLCDVAEALEYCHQQGVIHRDVKPRNVVVDRESGQALLVDFGMAKRHDTQGETMVLTTDGEIVGTPAYMPPELADTNRGRQIGPRADVYSLGAVLFFLLTGQPPFQGATAFNTIYAVLEQEPPDPRSLNPQAPPELVELCLACMAKDPAQRPASAAVVARRLRVFGRKTRRHHRRSLARWPVAVMLLGLGSAAAIVLTAEPATRPEPDETTSPTLAPTRNVASPPSPPPEPTTPPATPTPRETLDPVDETLRAAAEEVYERVAAAKKGGDWEEVVEICDEALELDPSWVSPYATRGYACYRLERYEDAVESFRRATELDPDTALHHANLGVNLERSGRSSEAAVAYGEAIRLEPDSVRHRANRRECLWELGEHAAAFADQDRLIELDPSGAAFAQRGFMRWQRKQYAEAVEDYREAVRLEPEVGLHHFNLGVNQAGLGNYVEAVSALERARELDPDLTGVERTLKEYRAKLSERGE